MKLWKSSGFCVGNKFRTAIKIMLNPVFLITMAVIATVIMVLINVWKLYVVPLFSLGLTTLIIIYRHKAKNKLHISKRRAEKFNAFNNALSRLPSCYQKKIDSQKERTKNDNEASTMLFQRLGEAFITLGFYVEKGRNRINIFSGNEHKQIEIIEFYADLMLKEGVGYVVLVPDVPLISKAKSIDEKVISQIIRNIGLTEWTVELMNYNSDNIVLFVLTDESISRAYDVSRGGVAMFEKLAFHASEHENYIIPLQYGVDWSLRAAPHAIISGNTGSGKSYFLLYLILMISIKNGILFLADPKRSDLYSLSAFMPKNRVQHEAKAICEMISDVVGIMHKRYEFMEHERLQKGSFQDDFADYGIKPLVLVVEEMAAFVSSLDKKTRDSFEADIKSITMKGRQAGVILISVMQSPNTNNISSESRSQTGLRVYLGKSGGIEYRMLFGEGYKYSNRVHASGQGLYMISGKTEKPEMLETPRLDKKQLAEALKRALESQFDVNY